MNITNCQSIIMISDNDHVFEWRVGILIYGIVPVKLSLVKLAFNDNKRGK